ncbi:hypothetical protein NB2BOR_A16320 [Bordetella parapertussis]|nr:hypothetical protein NB2BOR_A16320 [Bordetella parapertussis]
MRVAVSRRPAVAGPVCGYARRMSRFRSTFWRCAFVLAFLASALVAGWLRQAAPSWGHALLYGAMVGGIVLCLALLFDDLAWWGTRLVQALKRMRP